MFKTYLFALVLSLTTLPLASFAWVSTGSVEKEFNFKFKFKGETLVLQQKGNSYEEAYERAAQSCFRHFKSGKRVGEQLGLDIIDICANPRT